MDFNNSIYNLAEDLKVRIAVNRASWWEAKAFFQVSEVKHTLEGLTRTVFHLNHHVYWVELLSFLEEVVESHERELARCHAIVRLFRGRWRRRAAWNLRTAERLRAGLVRWPDTSRRRPLGPLLVHSLETQLLQRLSALGNLGLVVPAACDRLLRLLACHSHFNLSWPIFVDGLILIYFLSDYLLFPLSNYWLCDKSRLLFLVSLSEAEPPFYAFSQA